MDTLAVFIYGILGALKIVAELTGYWFAIVLVLFLKNGQLTDSIIFWAMVGSAVLAVCIRLVLNRLE